MNITIVDDKGGADVGTKNLKKSALGTFIDRWS